MGQHVALKEWAVIIQALLQGNQHLLLRKGGIREETRDFRLQSDEFYLFPTYEHQKKECIQDVYRAGLQETIVEWEAVPSSSVRLTAYAKVSEELLIHEREELDKLRPFHIFTDAFAETRFRWKPKKPLHVLLLRVYRLAEPLDVSMKESYNGCRSWIRLEEEVNKPGLIPVLSDEAFAVQKAAVLSALERA
ncbi:DUF1802 family protein [Paenibacillus senegalensis]|uniref:DUF1802 family protein n=1 Tax=Paenibacillus senegalensis TaxID=1465766 RepID=UPI000287BA1D|nr:DUF1802 family protein [Paenibacillus senegalensis]